MEHGDYLIDTLDSNGQEIGRKLRRDIDKRNDIFRSVYVLVLTPAGTCFLCALTTDSLFPSKLGLTVGGIVRHGETYDEAALRTLQNEINLDKAPTQVGCEMVTLAIGARRSAAAYYVVADIDLPEDGFRHVPLSEMDELVQKPAIIADTLTWFWTKFGSTIKELDLVS